jgi:hypothetical protein
MLYKVFLFVALPVLALAAYLIARLIVPIGSQKFLYAENGPVELGTAICFASASVGAIALSRKRVGTPSLVAVHFRVFAVACAFVSLEEISYGQQIFQWASPQWFRDNNHHGQTNLHNLLGNQPSHILKRLGNYGTLVAFIVVPGVAMCTSRAYRAGHWTYYMLPRAELFAATALAQLCSVLWKAKELLGDSWHRGWNEMREFYWAVAALSYVLVMRQRLLGADSGAGAMRSIGLSGGRAEVKDAA